MVVMGSRHGVVDDFALSFAPGSIAPRQPRADPLSFFGIHVGNFLQSRLRTAAFEPPTSGGRKQSDPGSVPSLGR